MSEIESTRVLAFLKENPQFLKDPTVVLQLQLGSGLDGPTALVDRQIAQLRDRLAELERTVANYHELAGDNERRMRRLHDLYLAMLPARNRDDLVRIAREALLGPFGCDYAVIDAPSDESLADEPRVPTATAVTSTLVGRVSRDTLDAVFGSRATDVGSAILVPMGKPSFGVLGLAARDPDRFFPGVGTLFVELLGQMIGQRLIQVAQRESNLVSESDVGRE